MTRIIGIDLGTTNSCVAIYEDGKARVLVGEDGLRTVPSVVAFSDKRRPSVGHPALRQAVTNPTRTIYESKRLIGKKVNSPDVKKIADNAPYEIVAAKNGDAWIGLGSSSISPQEVGAYVLERLRENAEAVLGCPITEAVITVPAYFDEMQRQATRDAGKLAGLEVARILNEPTAAALAYGAHKEHRERRTIAVFDLGGGTFDISIMSIENGVFEVLSTCGDTSLGGADWDRLLVRHWIDRIFDAHRIDLSEDPVAMGRLRAAAETAKRALSSESSTAITLPYLHQGTGPSALNFDTTLSRSDMEKLCASALVRLRAPCETALSDAALLPSDIDEVLLVGGMSRMPAVQKVVEDIFQQQPAKCANPDEVVALGAAAQGAILGGLEDEATLIDVASHTIGIKVGSSAFAPVIERNSMLPVRAEKLFATQRSDQDFVLIEIYQGESNSLKVNRRLGSIRLGNLPQAPAGNVKIRLAMSLNVEGLLSVSATELRSGTTATTTIKSSGGLSSDDIELLTAKRREEQAKDS